MAEPQPGTPSRLNWGRAALRFLFLYVVTWVGIAAWTAWGGALSFWPCLFNRSTALLAGLWCGLLAIPFAVITGILGALCSRELAVRWKVLVAALVGIIALQELWLLGGLPPPTVSPMWTAITETLALPRPNDAAGATAARSGRARASSWTLRGPQPSSTQDGSLLHNLTVLMRSLQQSTDTQRFYELDDHTKALLHDHHLHPQAKSPPTSD